MERCIMNYAGRFALCIILCKVMGEIILTELPIV